MEVVVSICCVTYNHAKFIRSCLQGFLMQQCDFPFEILIYDDASTDGTKEILQNYQKEYPDLIKLILAQENQYSKTGGVGYFNMSIPVLKAKGKYIALCEGDDNWTNPLKLQHQIGFMERNPEFILTTGGYISKIGDREQEFVYSGRSHYIDETERGFEFGMYDRKGLTKTLTVVFRKEKSLFAELVQYKYGRDTHLAYHLLKMGKAYYFKEVFGVYNFHEGGVWSMKNRAEQLLMNYNVFKELYQKNRDEYPRYRYLTTCLEIVNLRMSYTRKKTTLKTRNLLLESGSLLRTRSEYMLYVKSLVPQQIKSYIRKAFRL